MPLAPAEGRVNTPSVAWRCVYSGRWSVSLTASYPVSVSHETTCSDMVSRGPRAAAGEEVGGGGRFDISKMLISSIQHRVDIVSTLFRYFVDIMSTSSRYAADIVSTLVRCSLVIVSTLSRYFVDMSTSPRYAVDIVSTLVRYSIIIVSTLSRHSVDIVSVSCQYRSKSCPYRPEIVHHWGLITMQTLLSAGGAVELPAYSASALQFLAVKVPPRSAGML